MSKKQRLRKKRRGRAARIIILIVVIIAILALIVIKVFTVETVKVEGNSLYSDKKIEKLILNDDYSWNSMYVFAKYKLKDSEELPFVDSVEVSLEDPHTLVLTVYEKGMLGYVYVPSLKKYAYLDKDGYVVEISKNALEDNIQICGLYVKTATLYKKLPVEDSSILKTLLNVSTLLEKYELTPDLMYVSDGDVILSYGDIQVNVGKNRYLNEKILRLQKIMPKIKKKTGTLHLETWTESNTDIYFTKKELIDIPVEK